MKTIIPTILTLILLSLPTAAFAQFEDSYSPAEPLVTTPWYENMTAEEKMADMHFIKHMRPHHAGALTMSEEYLNAPDTASARMKHLARAIIHNQLFEIGVLDTIEAHLKTVDIQPGESKWVRSATGSLAQNQRFVFAAIPSLLAGDEVVTERDVAFAKAMIVHHEGAVDMCRTYTKNPDAENGYLKEMCLDIIVGQTQEIELMHDIIAGYAGDADEIRITPAMVHGMDHMLHGKDVNEEYRKSREING